jgi:hypothetical protein
MPPDAAAMPSPLTHTARLAHGLHHRRWPSSPTWRWTAHLQTRVLRQREEGGAPMAGSHARRSATGRAKYFPI